jgi:hypothetical protein
MSRKPRSGAAVSGSAFACHEPHRSRFHWPKSCRAHGAALFQQTAAIRQEIKLVRWAVLWVFPGFFLPRKRLEDCASPGAHFILCF